MNKTTQQLWQLNKYTWMSLAFVLVYLPVARAQGLFIVPDWVAWTLVQIHMHAPLTGVFFCLYASHVTFLYLVSALARRISANAAA